MIVVTILKIMSDIIEIKKSKPRAEKYEPKLFINTDFESAVKVMFKNVDKSKSSDKKAK